VSLDFVHLPFHETNGTNWCVEVPRHFLDGSALFALGQAVAELRRSAIWVSLVRERFLNAIHEGPEVLAASIVAFPEALGWSDLNAVITKELIQDIASRKMRLVRAIWGARPRRPHSPQVLRPHAERENLRVAEKFLERGWSVEIECGKARRPVTEGAKDVAKIQEVASRRQKQMSSVLTKEEVKKRNEDSDRLFRKIKQSITRLDKRVAVLPAFILPCEPHSGVEPPNLPDAFWRKLIPYPTRTHIERAKVRHVLKIHLEPRAAIIDLNKGLNALVPNYRFSAERVVLTAVTLERERILASDERLVVPLRKLAALFRDVPYKDK
jgi:hypothetical protein